MQTPTLLVQPTAGICGNSFRWQENWLPLLNSNSLEETPVFGKLQVASYRESREKERSACHLKMKNRKWL